MLQKELKKRWGIQAKRWGKASSGLARPDFHNWPEKVPNLMRRHRPDYVVVSLGTNDHQALKTKKGWIRTDNERWANSYKQRVLIMLRRLSGRDRRRAIVWLGPTNFKSSNARKLGPKLNNLVREAIAEFDGPAIFVDARSATSNKKGEPGVTYRHPKKGVRPMRTSDGIHLTTEAVRTLLAAPVYEAFAACWDGDVANRDAVRKQRKEERQAKRKAKRDAAAKAHGDAPRQKPRPNTTSHTAQGHPEETTEGGTTPRPTSPPDSVTGSAAASAKGPDVEAPPPGKDEAKASNKDEPPPTTDSVTPALKETPKEAAKEGPPPLPAADLGKPPEEAADTTLKKTESPTTPERNAETSEPTEQPAQDSGEASKTGAVRPADESGPPPEKETRTKSKKSSCGSKGAVKERPAKTSTDTSSEAEKEAGSSGAEKEAD